MSRISLRPLLAGTTLMLALHSAGCNLFFGIEELAAGQSDAAPGTPDAAPGTPDAAPGTPDAAPGTPDAAPGIPDAAPPPDGPPDPFEYLGFRRNLTTNVLFQETSFWMVPLPKPTRMADLHSFGIFLRDVSSAEVRMGLYVETLDGQFAPLLGPVSGMPRIPGAYEIDVADAGILLFPDSQYWVGLQASNDVPISGQYLVSPTALGAEHAFVAGWPDPNSLTDFADLRMVPSVYLKIDYPELSTTDELHLELPGTQSLLP